MDAVTLRQYETLSPFEIKNDLAKVAAKTAKASQVAYLNAGRGNPNWIATEPRSAFFLLGQFAVTESQRTMQLSGGLGGMAKAPGIAARLASWLEAHARHARRRAPRDSVIPWAVTTFGFSADAFVHELVDSILGDNYPVPDRMLVHNERIVREYLQWAMCGDPRPAGTFDLYAVEGGTAAMCYIFKSLKANRLLNPGDTIAMVTPIFTPYLEMPHLEDYGLHMIVSIQARQEQRWQFTDEDLATLLDPKVKAFFVVNPGNPYAVALSRESIAAIGRVLEKRPDFMLLDRRRLRDLRARVPLAARRVSQKHALGSTPTASISAAPAGGSASSPCTRRTCSTRRLPRFPTRSSRRSTSATRR